MFTRLMRAGTILFSLCFFLIHCSGNDEQREFERQAFQLPQGYTQTDGNGNLPENGMVDPDDWRTAPFFQGLVDVHPSYPNPSLTTDRVQIEVLVAGIESVMGLRVMVILESDHFQTLDRIDEAPLRPGLHTLEFSPTVLGRFNDPESARGLHRVILFDRNENIISYGDIKVE